MTYSWTFLAVAVVLVLTPGADFAVIVRNTVSGGRPTGPRAVEHNPSDLPRPHRHPTAGHRSSALAHLDSDSLADRCTGR